MRECETASGNMQESYVFFDGRTNRESSGEQRRDFIFRRGFHQAGWE